ncbi:hypothetical protein [Moraxella marmotae]|uniref:hypothetical protein n=1 Tax=Moraxella marmotae TaxID=3344520 RepID=UPI0035F477FC
MKSLMNKTLAVAASAVLLATATIATTNAQAHSFGKNEETCFLIKGDKVVKKGKCTVDVGSGAGGIYTNIKIDKKTYLYETTFEEQDNFSYNRSAKTFKKISPKNLGKKFLICYQDKPYDVCTLSTD